MCQIDLQTSRDKQAVLLGCSAVSWLRNTKHIHSACPVVTVQQYKEAIWLYFIQITVITFVYSHYLPLLCQCCTFLACILSRQQAKSPNYRRWETHSLQLLHKKLPAPCRVLAYLHATPILFFNLVRFKVTEIATCRTADCDSVKKGPAKWIGHAEGDRDRWRWLDRESKAMPQC